MKKSRFIKALLREPVDATPIWIMRQAGRYLPEYRKLRQQAKDFIALYKSPELACEITLQPLARFDLDAAILFSDILTIPEAYGLGLHFAPGEGPQFRHPIRTLADIHALPQLNVEQDFDYIVKAIELITKELNHTVPLIGFAGSPWTLATYMVEGGPTKDFRVIKNMLYSEPETLHALLDKLSRSVIDYLNLQIKAGAKAIQLFDTWGGVLSTSAYQQFSLQYMQKIINALIKEVDGETVPVIVFTKNGGQWLEMMSNIGAHCLGIDWTFEMSDAKQKVGNCVALQGNLDPAVLYADNAIIRQEVTHILQQFGKGSGHVFNLGHGIHRDVNPDKVKFVVDTVHELSADSH